LEAIRRGEDRARFASTLRAAGQPVLPGEAVSSIEDALAAAERLGYPVMCRSGFALGGAGSGIAANQRALRDQVQRGLRSSGSGQVLVERSVRGWGEIEYEVIRDRCDNCIVVCNMENIDPMGVHTGDSIVVAPSQTLSDEEYQRLRTAACAVVRALGVEGACNVQFALDPVSGRYYVIEVNPRLSRSSALASKATGYPIAKVATHIALGATLPEIRNDITGTSAFFEPALDYVTVKIPRWPFDKFASVPTTIGTGMRSTGEVMAIGRTFEEAARKALRSLDSDARRPREQLGLEARLAEPNGERLQTILEALRQGWEPERLAKLSEIHPWFLDRLVSLASPRDVTTNGGYPSVYKMVDTCSAEFEARTPYFYGTSAGNGHTNEAWPLPGPKAIILGSGPIRIGQGIEFDYATVHACHALSACGVRSIVVNNNPETVSTDFSTSDRLYFEPLDLEAVTGVVANEANGLLGVIPQFGGQTAVNLVQPLHERSVPILGTPPAAIDLAEDRGKTSALLASLGIPAPRWQRVERWQDLPAAVELVGLPALLRPSYVLSGQGMTIVRRASDVDHYLQHHSENELAKPLLVDAFLEGAIELNVDAVSDACDVVSVSMEQLEECGIHSGDSTDVYPTQTVEGDVLETVEVYTRRLAQELEILGLMNVQYAVSDGTVYVLEVNPRASRSVPFASKASGIPLADLAIRVILGERLSRLSVPSPRCDRVCVKRVVFPFRTFPDLPPILGPEMQSTGEAMGIGATFAQAYWKSWLGAGAKELPFGRPVYVSASAEGFGQPLEDGSYESLVSYLAAVGCSILAAPGTSFSRVESGARVINNCPPDNVSVDDLGIAIILDSSPEELDLLQRAAANGVPFIADRGAFRGLMLALREGVPSLEVVAHHTTPPRSVSYSSVQRTYGTAYIR
jgi:carbamoyl-phosphate synthase large subunit